MDVGSYISQKSKLKMDHVINEVNSCNENHIGLSQQSRLFSLFGAYILYRNIKTPSAPKCIHCFFVIE
jgi:hypothetical protein